MNAIDFLLISYLAFDDLMPGNRLLNTRVYFLNIKTRLNFEYYQTFYGPYSGLVESENLRLKDLRAISMVAVERGSGGFERWRRVYNLTEYGKTLAWKVQESHAEIFANLNHTAGIIGISEDYMMMCAAAKMHYEPTASKLGFEISGDQLNAALDLIKRLDNS